MTPEALVSACRFKRPDAIAAYRAGWTSLHIGQLSTKDREVVRMIFMGLLYNDVPPDAGLAAAAGYVDVLAIDQSSG